LVTALLRVRPQPGPAAVAVPQRPRNGRAHQGTGLATLAEDENLRDVAAGAALIHPELAAALRVALVDEAIPVDVADVALAAGADEADRNDRALALVVVDELALAQRLAVDQEARAGHAAPLAPLDVLGDEPLRELPGGDARPGRRRVLVVRRRREKLQRRQRQESLELLDQPRLVDLLADPHPVIEPPDNNGLRRQVHQRSGAEGRDDLAVSNLTVGASIRLGHQSSSSTSMLSSVL